MPHFGINFCFGKHFVKPFIFLIFIVIFQDSFGNKRDNWLKLHLKKPVKTENVKDIKVALKLKSGWRVKSIQLKGGHDQSDLIEAAFELGENDNVDSLKIIWPGGEQILNKIRANQTIVVYKPEFPSPPSNLFARIISLKQIDLVWKDNSSDELGFCIERSIFPDKGFKQIGTVKPNINYFSDKDLKVNTTYYYRVKAIIDEGYSVFDDAYQKTEQNTGLVLEDVTKPLRMYPNPNSDFLDIRVNNEIMGNVIVRFLTEGGKEIKKYEYAKNIKDLKKKVDISSLPIGVFMVEVYQVTYKTIFNDM